MNRTIEQARPNCFSLDIEAQENEIFNWLPEELAGGAYYEVSNLGRVRSQISTALKILLPYKVHENGNFFVKLKGKQFPVKDLVHFGFIGEIKKGYSVVFIDGNKFNLNVKNLKSCLFAETKEHKNQLSENLPYKFTKDARPILGEEFRKVCDYDLMYSVSNFGRVRNDKKGTILSMYRPEGTGKIYARIKKNLVRIQDLMYRAFIGSIPKNMIVICKDGDRRNLTLDNLQLTKASHKEKYKKTEKREKMKPRADIMKGMPQEREVSLHDLKGEEKAAQVARLNELSKCYYTDTVQNGVYYLKLKNS